MKSGNIKRGNGENRWEFIPSDREFTLGGMPLLFARLMAQKGIVGRHEVEDFLAPSLAKLPSPSSLAGLAEALAVLEEGLARKSSVLIYGDYDADGVTATALLISFLEEVGFNCFSYIPDRSTEGYGLNIEALQRERARIGFAGGENLILITVDCGISARREVAEAQRLGFKVIITDHHQPPSVLPEAEAVINPNRTDCLFPCKDLAGVGVAFYLVMALRSLLIKKGYWPSGRHPNLKKYLDLVAIGTIADMVSLTGANRIMVKAGLEVLREHPRSGLKALMEVAAIPANSINSSQIGFQIAPRINAAGRIGSAGLALDLLIGKDPAKVREYACELERVNNSRKELSEKIFNEAIKQAELQVEEGRKTLVVVSASWHVGVSGLVASRLVKSYCRPAVVLIVGDDGLAVGSVRTVDGVDIYQVLEECSGLLEKFGGHKAAAGITLHEEAISDFSERFEASVDRKIGAIDSRPVIRVNLKAPIGAIMDPGFLEFYERMEPFGCGNLEPIFCLAAMADTTLIAPRKIGRDSVRFRISENGLVVDGVAFGMSHMLPVFKNGPVNLAFKIMKNEFRGRKKWEVRVEDIISHLPEDNLGNIPK